MNKVTIPIFYAIDDGYSKFVAVSIKSLIMNANNNYNYDINVIYENLSEENAKKLKSLETDNVKIILTEMNQNLSMITDKLGNRLREYTFTLTIFFRLFIPVMFPKYDKCIYIDADTVIPGDISRLYNEDLGNNYLGCIVDKSTIDNEILASYFEEVVGIPRDKYINSGVLLMNSKKLRELKIDEKFLDLYIKYGFDVIAPDQDYINSMCYGHIKYLSDIYDAMPNPNNKEVEKPVIIHYNLFLKPWQYENVQYYDYFWKYAKSTPFYDEILEIKNSYTNEDRKKDSEWMDLMVSRAESLVGTQNTLKNVFESGKETRL
ncbi:glycosyltransferase family 8 protein [bacterium]|nr:glycosyltransferase family 8 protein [bacterium]